MLSCESALERMSEALDAPLPLEARLELEEHLAACPQCRAAYQALTQMEERLGYAKREAAQRADLDRLEQLVMEVRCCNTGLFTPVPQITRDTDEMLAILRRLNN